MNQSNHQMFKRLRPIAYLLTFLALSLGISLNASAQTYALSNLFTIPTGTGNLLASATGNRGFAYDSIANLIYVANSSATSVSAFDGNAGTFVNNLDMTGVSGGTTFSIDQIGVAQDGVIYGVNLCTSSSSNNKIYRWANSTATPTVAASTNGLANGTSLSYISGRIGDTMAVTGSGSNTLILCGVGAKPYFILFSTVDGLNFTPTIINVASGLSVAGNIFGLSFYTNGTFLIKPASSSSSTTYLIQYPSNFASQALVTGTVLGSTALGSSYNNTTMLSYNQGNGLLGVITTGGNPSPVGVLNASNFTSGVTSLATTNAVTAYNGGNASGGSALGTNNVIYVYNTGDAVYAYKLITIPSQPPTITTQPAGGSVYPPYTLSVTATGTAPLRYQWQATNAGAGTFTNISGATNSSYVVSSFVTNFYYDVIVTNAVGAVTSSIVQVSTLHPVTSSVVTNLWQIAAGASGYPYLIVDDKARGIAYDTNTQRVVVASGTGGSSLNIINGLNGTNIGTLAIGSATFTGLLGYVDQVGIADDGAVYAANLMNGGGFKIYRWGAPTTTATNVLAFSDANSPNLAVSADRWGDTMAVRGAGTSTQILLGSRAATGATGTNIAILTTTDGTNFYPIVIPITNAPGGFSGEGITFGAGNTFWANTGSGGHIYYGYFDTNAQLGAITLDYPGPSKIPSALSGVGVDSVRNILVGINLADVYHDAQLYQLTGTSDAPVLFDQAFFASANVNGNGSVAIAMKYPYLYALDANNGVIGLTYGVPPSTPPVITSSPGNQTVYPANPAVIFTVGLTGSLPIYYQWQYGATTNSFTNIITATNSALTLNYPQASAAGYYRVIVHNIAGSATSAPPALLTVLLPVTNSVVSNLWTVPANSVPGYAFLDGSTGSYSTRGMSYDPSTTNLLVADHFNIYVLSTANGLQSVTNGVAFNMNTAGMPTGGINSWTIDQIGVADDGILYSANLSGDGNNFSISSWSSVSSSAPQSTPYLGNDLAALSPGDRYGDDMAIRGAGINTQILFGSYGGTNVALFTTTDGVNFTPQLITVTDTSVSGGYAGAGIAFGLGNTFWAKGGHNYNLRQIGFSLSSTNATVLQTYNCVAAGGIVPNDLTGLYVDVTNNILSGVCYNDSPHDMQLFRLSGNANAPSVFDQSFFGSANANSQENSVTVLKNGLGFGLDVNNGLVAIGYGVPTAPGVSFVPPFVYAPGSVSLTITNVFPGHSYQLQSRTNLSSGNWVNVGSAVSTTNATATIFDTSPATTSKFYRVTNN